MKNKTYWGLLFIVLLGSFLFVNESKVYAKGSEPEYTLKKNEFGDEITITITKKEKYDKYVIQMKSDSQTKLKTIKTLKESGTGTCSYTVKKLKPGTYSFRVKGYNIRGYYDYSKTKRMTLNQEAQGNNLLINSEVFPDDIFRKWVKENIDTDGDGQLSENEINIVTEIIIRDSDVIFSLKGIEVFKNLKILNFGTSGCLGKLDLSKNPKLEEVYCTSSGLKKLKIGKNSALRVLYCNGNANMESLDLKYAINLEELDCSECSRLEKLNIKNAKKLVKLDCNRCNLYSLDIKKSSSLEELDVRYNKYLKNLDLSNNILLSDLEISFSGVEKLDLRKNSALTKLNISSDQSYMVGQSNYSSNAKIYYDYDKKSSPYKYYNESGTGKLVRNNK